MQVEREYIGWQLRIPKETFVEMFPDFEDLFIFETNPLSDEDFLDNYLASKLWRLNNIYTIIDKYGNKILFKMNYAQFLVYSKIAIHPRLIILKSRQQGISTLWLVSYFDDCLTIANTNTGMVAQNKDAMEDLLTRVDELWNNLDFNIIDALQLKLETNNTKELSLNNGSKFRVRTSFRSGTLHRLHVSEYGKIAKESPKKAKEIRTGTLQALAQGNPGIIESTAEGKNDFYHQWNKAISILDHERSLKDFYPIFLSWLDDPTCVSEVKKPMTKVATEYFEELEIKTGRILSKPKPLLS